MEDTMDDKETVDMLSKEGFTEAEIERLERLQREYAEHLSQDTSIIYRRLEFVRWLIATGKLNEQAA
jgi:uncharacterized protein (UPF0335 family)